MPTHAPPGSSILVSVISGRQDGLQNNKHPSSSTNLFHFRSSKHKHTPPTTSTPKSLARTSTNASSTSSSSTLHDTSVHVIDHAPRPKNSGTYHEGPNGVASSSSSLASASSHSSASSASSTASMQTFHTAYTKFHELHSQSHASSPHSNPSQSAQVSDDIQSRPKQAKTKFSKLSPSHPPMLRTSSGHPLSHHGHGSTSRVEIREHACRWDHRVEAGIRIDVANGNGGEAQTDGREGILGRRNLKLVVHQVSQSSRRARSRASFSQPKV